MRFGLKSLIFAAAIVGGGVLMSGCAAKTINLNDYLTVKYGGYDTVGTASFQFDAERMVEENKEYFADENGEFTISGLYTLAEEIDGELSETKNLTNGDVIEFVWADIDVDKLREEYGVKFSFKNEEHTIEGLEQAKEFDPFKYVTITYDGTAPYGRAVINVDYGTDDVPARFDFVADKNTNLRNGDTIKVSISAGTFETLSDLCIREGFKLTGNEKEYTVEGLLSYAMDFDAIPTEFMDKMLKQADDIITADCSGWSEGNTLTSKEFIGCYFLKGKEGFFTYPYNRLYCVYKMTANMTGYTMESKDTIITGTDEYYTYVLFEDIQVLPDGTYSVDFSKADLCSDGCESIYGWADIWSWGFYYFRGFNDLDSMFNDCVTQNMEKYDYVSSVK